MRAPKAIVASSFTPSASRRQRTSLRLSAALNIGIVVTPLLALTPQFAFGQSVLGLAGYEGSRWSNYGYLGAIVAPSGDLNTTGPVVRLWAEHLNYSFLNNGDRVTANANGLKLSAGYQWRNASDYTTLYLGVAERNTSLPSDISSPVSGSHTGATLAVENHSTMSSATAFDGIAMVEDSQHDYWARGRIMTRLSTGTLTLGPELVLQGSRLYSAQHAGLALMVSPSSSHVAFDFSAGYEKTRDLPSGAYASIGISVPF